MALDKFQPYLFVSAGEQSNKLLTPTYSGGIASFQAQRAQQLTKLLVQIDPVQAGTGDPAPDNIRPITGRTGMTVTRAGENLLKLPYAEGTKTQNDITFTVNADGSIRVAGTATGTATLILANTATLNELPFLGSDVTVTLSGCPSGGSGSTYYMAANFAGDNTGDVDASNLADTGAGDTKYYTNAHVKSSGNLFIRVSSGVTINKVFYPMLVLADSVTEWQPPTVNQTIPITWESEAGTVYGGTLDVVSGVLTVTHGYILLDETQGIRKNGRSAVTQRAFVYIEGKAFGRTNIQSNRFSTPSTVEDKIGYMVGRDTSNGIEFYLPVDGTEDTNASCKQWFADNNTQLVYELATPQTYQLTPTEVQTIAGYNQIYADTGAVLDVEF